MLPVWAAGAPFGEQPNPEGEARRLDEEAFLPAWQRTGGEVVLSAHITQIGAPGELRKAAVNSSEGHDWPLEPGHHLPVMAAEVVAGLAVADGGVYLDGTLGEGGHSLAILQHVPDSIPGPAPRNTAPQESNQAAGLESRELDAANAGMAGASLVIGIDLDRRSVAEAARRLAPFGARFLPLQGNYADMLSLAGRHGIHAVDGVLLDLGFSSRQVDRPGYGFSFHSDEPLDMRYDAEQGVSAAELVNNTGEEELAGIFRRYGEEPRARGIARAIARQRAARPINTGAELASAVERAAGRRPGHRLHPATRVFQALRIAVNRELENLQAGLEASVALLRPGGRLAVISYHSLEDRIVKNFMAHQSAVCVCPPGLPECVCNREPALAVVNRRIIRPAGDEVAFNPRSRSARLRVARRIQSRHEPE